MNNCEGIDCEYCVTHDEDRIEYCWLYNTDCQNVPKCNKYEQLKEQKNE